MGSEQVRIAELSQRTEIPVATIKYYLREGLLPPGTTTAPNQAQYDEHHVARLRLIRALREGAGLSIATLGRVFAAMATHQPEDWPAYLTLAVRALSEPLDVPEPEAAEYDQARREVDALLNDLGWNTQHPPPRPRPPSPPPRLPPPFPPASHHPPQAPPPPPRRGAPPPPPR